jgi:hypothetical protein
MLIIMNLFRTHYIKMHKHFILLLPVKIFFTFVITCVMLNLLHKKKFYMYDFVHIIN